MSRPVVSIVVPAYNHARYLSECIDSILGQGYPALELIVIDDGSTDNTPEIIETYCALLRHERQANQGQSATLNRGWAIARGEILAYLSADDFLYPGAIAAATNVLYEDSSVAMTYCDYQLIDGRSQPIRTVETHECDFATMVAEYRTVAGPGMFFRRSALEKVGGWDSALRQGPDLDFVFRLGLAGALRRIPRVLAAYRVHSEAQSRTPPDAARSEEPIAIIEKFFSRDDLPANVSRVKRAAFASAHIVAARQHLRSRRWTKGWKHLSAAARIRPRSVARMPRVLGQAFVQGIRFRPHLDR